MCFVSMKNRVAKFVRTSAPVPVVQHRRGPGKRRRGASAVELALVAPFVFMLLFGSFEFARVMTVKQALTNAARVSCRKASLANTNDVEMARELAYNGLQGLIPNPESNTSLTITISPADLNDIPSGTEVTATVEVLCQDITWLPPVFLSGAKIQANATARRE
jgi:Flp pilus assembly protein TadG